METSYLSHQEIREGEEVKGEDLREGIFDLINRKFPEFGKKRFYFYH
ncbi:hypothetical protein [Chryseobacterium sp. POE27]